MKFTIFIIVILLVLLVGSFLLINNKKHELYSILSPSKLDVFESTWLNMLFNTKGVNNIKSFTKDFNYIEMESGDRLALIKVYHHLDLSANTIDQFKKRPGKDFILVIDGEPNSISSCTSADLILSTKSQDYAPPYVPYIYIPYWVYSFFQYKLDPMKLLKSPNEEIPRKTKFCYFAYSNCDEKFGGVRNRKKFYHLIQKMSGNRVDNLGNCYNSGSISKKKGGVTTNASDSDLQAYKFVIAFENESMERDYITEKLTNPMFSRTIPIYLGAGNTGKYFNPRSFINIFDFSSFEECINYILKVDADDALYMKIQREPYFHGNRFPKIMELFYGGSIYREIYSHFPRNIQKYILPNKITSSTIVMVTFADGQKYTTDRIEKEALKSQYFDQVVVLSPTDIPEFMKEHEPFISSNSRGFGYWIWKPYVILKILNQSKEGDLIVWSDSGNTINLHNADTMLQYYTLLLEGKDDLIGFEMQYPERHWSKMDTIQKICGYNNLSYLKSNQLQLTSGLIIMKKTPRVIQLMNQWLQLVLANKYHYVDNTPSVFPNYPEFKEHRHDQSIYSLLMLQYGCHRIYKHDTHEKDLSSPFNSTRILK